MIGAIIIGAIITQLTLVSVVLALTSDDPAKSPLCYICATYDPGAAVTTEQMAPNLRNNSYCWLSNTTVLDAAGFRNRCPQYKPYTLKKNYAACHVGLLYDDVKTRAKVVGIQRGCWDNSPDYMNNDCGIANQAETNLITCSCNGTEYCNKFSNLGPKKTDGPGQWSVATGDAPGAPYVDVSPLFPTEAPPTCVCPSNDSSTEPEICTTQCNNPYYCPKQDPTKPWPCGNPYGCGPWKCEANTWMCLPPKDIVNVWHCGHPLTCKPPQPNPWNCTSPWNCSIPQHVKDEFGCTNPWDCKPSKSKYSYCRSPFDCLPPDAIMACLINPQPNCTSTAGSMQDVPAWMFMMMMSNMQRLTPQVALPNVQQNQAVSWNGQQFVVVNVTTPQGKPSGSGQGFDVSGGMSVRSVNLAFLIAPAMLMSSFFLLFFSSY